jgi:hypothetical protein
VTAPRFVYLDSAAFWSSSSVLELDGEARAAYALCLMRQARSGTLPADVTRLAKQVGYPELVNIWPRLVRVDDETGEEVHLFPLVEGSKTLCANPRMAAEWKAASDHVRKLSRAGSAGGKASAAARADMAAKREKQDIPDDSTIVQRSSERPSSNRQASVKGTEGRKEGSSGAAAALQAASSSAAACATLGDGRGAGGGAVPSQPPGGAAGTAPTAKAGKTKPKRRSKTAGVNEAGQGGPKTEKQSSRDPRDLSRSNSAVGAPAASQSASTPKEFLRLELPSCPKCGPGPNGPLIIAKAVPNPDKPSVTVCWWQCGRCTSKWGRVDLPTEESSAP